jgi:hypothetical protein
VGPITASLPPIIRTSTPWILPDFTPEKLARYLLLLDANDNFYNEYFWWKDHWRVESGVEQMAQHAFCHLCKKLHEDEKITKWLLPRIDIIMVPKNTVQIFFLGDGINYIIYYTGK